MYHRDSLFADCVTLLIHQRISRKHHEECRLHRHFFYRFLRIFLSKCTKFSVLNQERGMLRHPFSGSKNALYIIYWKKKFDPRRNSAKKHCVNISLFFICLQNIHNYNVKYISKLLGNARRARISFYKEGKI